MSCQNEYHYTIKRKHRPEQGCSNVQSSSVQLNIKKSEFTGEIPIMVVKTGSIEAFTIPHRNARIHHSDMIS